MFHSARRGPRGSQKRDSAALPTTIWLPRPEQSRVAPAPGAVLPDWAIEMIRTEFVERPDGRPATLLKVSIQQDLVPGADACMPCTSYTDEDGTAPGSASVLLAELHPDALPASSDALGVSERGMPGAMENGWPGFFHRAHRLLPADGLLLLATRQRRDAGVLTDPLGSLVAAARTAGFRYLQHIVILYARAVDDALAPAPPGDAAPGVIHGDLLVLSAIHHA
ncbi:hypothetical protein GTY57_04115 [Streptomyces sp. SID5475]|nr:hypothetical protein [Streptomyces sp. SID5475]